MKELETSALCLEWELLNRKTNPFTNRKIKKNGPTYKNLEKKCKKTTELFFPKPQKNNKKYIENLFVPTNNFYNTEYDGYDTDVFFSVNNCVPDNGFITDTNYIYDNNSCATTDAQTQTDLDDFVTPEISLDDKLSYQYTCSGSEIDNVDEHLSVFPVDSYVKNYKNLKNRIKEANNVCTYLNKTVTIADQQWCVSGPDVDKFKKYIKTFNILANGTFGIVSKVYFKNLDTPVIVKEAKFMDIDNAVSTTKKIEGRFRLQKKGNKNYFSLENLILEAIDRLILQPYHSPNFLLFYEATWCENCNMVVKKQKFQPGSCYLTFMEAADTDLFSIQLPTIYQQESVLYQILLGLHSLQKYLGLWHRDIKTDNIFIKKTDPGGLLKYNVDGEIYYIRNEGFIVYVADFNVADCLKPGVLSNEYYELLENNCYVQPIQVKYINSKAIGIPLENHYYKKRLSWVNENTEPVQLVKSPVSIAKMRADPIQFPYQNFFGDIQDIIRMFTGGKRAAINQNQNLVNPQLPEMYTRLFNAQAYRKKLPRITTKCVKYLLAKEMLKTLYIPPPKNSGKFYVIEEFTL